MTDLRDAEEFWDHLAWLEENQPQFLESLLRNGRLKQHLEGVADRAIQVAGRLVLNQRMDQAQATEIAYAEIVAPSNPDPPENPPKLSARGRKMLERFKAKMMDE